VSACRPADTRWGGVRQWPEWGDCVEKLGEPLLWVIFAFTARAPQNNDAHGDEKAIYY
jgi:hypothetical protein